MKKELSIGFSPCPNDTFIFYAMVHGLVFSDTIAFKVFLEDVETLNRMAIKGALDVSKISYHALGFLLDEYCLLRSGGALGRGCGPLLLSKHPLDLSKMSQYRVAVPGNMTTAFLLLRLALPEAGEIVTVPFHLIMDIVQKGEVDMGLVIHESRFTYPEYGLLKLMDLGDWWEEETGLPIPLGGIIAKRSLGRDMIHTIENLIRESLDYAIQNPGAASHYISQNAQELSVDVIQSHIDLYVNEFSRDLGEEGEEAVHVLMERAAKKGIILPSHQKIFMS